MKRALFLAVALSLGLHFPARAMDITQEEAGYIVGYDLDKVEEKGPELWGRIVKLKFNYRSTMVHPTLDGMTGTICLSQVTGSGVYRSGRLQVKIPKEAVEWFMKIPSKDGRATLVVIAKLGSDQYAPASLLGREIKTDSKGSHILW